jgi:hypothetical protein
MNWRSLLMRLAFGLILTLVCVIVGACAGSTSDVITLDVPEEVEVELDSGAPGDEYVYYTLAASLPESWEAFKEKGLWLCSEERPSLIPEDVAASLDGGGFLPGTLLNLKWETMEKTLQFDTIIVTVGVTYEGCIKGALGEMESSPGLILLTDRGADFQGKDRMVEIVFE